MTQQSDPVEKGGTALAVGEVLPTVNPAAIGTKAGSNEDLKALHADLTNAYREYLEMAKINPKMLNPTMLGLIQQFLKHNEISAEDPQKTELTALEKRLALKREAREEQIKKKNIVNLNQSKQE